ncbi:MAG TPA: triple tyrosine motif-containing protein [Puia sp.]|uniref:ligand-binding sensor domain-containing protein n=1 Tax=Puia sp. TaxID=2045100 RepID=UPI002CE0B89F|nr:triple tyrosine motif-containing protein [Puia sp.]HVU97288.1 triple tyrosine motif-containing protein [Puia sp.]
MPYVLRIKIAFTLFAGMFLGVCQGQNTIGIPDIVNYPRDVYNAGTQNRGIVQDRNGILYFANYQGLLSFDGNSWKNYPLPNKTVVRSVALGKDNRIYAGGQDDFGYFSPDKTGKLVFTSLKSLFSEKNNSFSDIWFIVPYGNDVFFMCREAIFQLNNKMITVYPAASEWRFLGGNDHQLIAQDGKNGLLEFRDGLWMPFIKESALPASYLATCLFPFGKDSSFLGTVNTGFYILSNNKITPFRFAGLNPFVNERVLTATAVSKDWLAIGTNLDGVYIVNKQGETIQNLSRKEGLQNNNILVLFLDRNKNLWMGLDNGIDFVAYNNAIKHIYPEKLNEGLGYCSMIFNKELFVGTSNGLYSLPVDDREDLSFLRGEFHPIPGTKGSTQGLSTINGELLLGHHDGAYLIRNDRLVPIDTGLTYWTFLPFSNVLPSTLVLAGNNVGINLLRYSNGYFRPEGDLPGYLASSQFMAIDNNNIIWVAHPYRGVYRVDVNDMAHPRVKLYTEKNGLPSYLKNHLFKVKNHIVIATEKGVYEYDDRRDAFGLSAYFKGFFGERNIRALKEDGAGNIWFIEDNSLGVIDLTGPKPETIYFPELSGKLVADYEHINPYDKYNVFVGAEKGFYHINYEEYKKNHYPIQVRIRSVRAFGRSDSLLFGGYFGEVDESLDQPASAVYNISNKWNSLHFEYASPLYAAQNSVTYSYYLKGFDRDWSDWSKRTEKEYTNLPAGTYTFQVRSKSNLGNESAINSYSFTILPPWYLTGWAYAGYVLILTGLLYFLYFWQRRIFRRQQQKHEEEQARLQYLHQLEMEKSEKEIVKLRNEKLEAEIEHKNTELASTAMHLVQKGELLSNIREELVRMKKAGNGEAAAADEFKKMLRILGEENKMDKDWEQFAVHFDKVHSDFLQMLKSAYPALSSHELKLCAYLRMSLSSKEIAQLENISVRGVEISRYRLRKKLKISTETNLFDFLMALHGSRPTPGSA